MNVLLPKAKAGLDQCQAWLEDVLTESPEKSLSKFHVVQSNEKPQHGGEKVITIRQKVVEISKSRPLREEKSGSNQGDPKQWEDFNLITLDELIVDRRRTLERSLSGTTRLLKTLIES